MPGSTMAKKIPCAGGCGKICERGGTSGPTTTCLDCRRARPGYHGKFASPAERRMITCEICGAEAPATTNRDSGDRRQKTCLSDECRRIAKRRKSQRYRDSGKQQRWLWPSEAACRIY